MAIKVGHFLNFAPHQAGIYGTARDLILAERKVGIDAQAIDYGNGLNAPQHHSRVWCKDGEVETISPQWAIDEADIICRHSAIPQKIFDTHKPIVMPLHGAPEYSFLLEHAGITRTLKELIVSAQNPDYKAFLTFWPQNVFYWKILLGKKIELCPPSVDLDFFKPEGKHFNFGKKAGDFNIVITNVWRQQYVTPYSVLFAAAKWIKERHPAARVHVFGIPADNKKYQKNDGPVNRTLLALQHNNLLGHAFPIIPNLDEVYRAADMMVTPHILASRTVREALASGCPIVGAPGNKFTPYTAEPRDIDGFVAAIDKCYQDIQTNRETVRNSARLMAEKEFNLQQVGETMKKIFERILE